MPKKLWPVLAAIRISILFCLPVVLTTHYSSIAYGATYYVAITGNDATGNGSSGSPWRTIQKGANTLNPGDTLVVRAGIYHVRVHLSKSGTASQPITIMGERNGSSYRTTVDGSEALTNWTSVGNGVYRATRPNWSYDSTLEACAMSADGKNVFHINTAWGDGGKGNNLTGHNALDTLALSSSYRYTYPYFANGGSTPVQFWDGLEALFANVGSFTYVRFRDGSNPNSKMIRVAPGRSHCSATQAVETATFLLRNRSHIIIRDLEIRGSEVQVGIRDAADNNVIENNHIHGGLSRVYLYAPDSGTARRPTGNVIRNNVIHSNNIGLGTYNLGAWEGGSGGTNAPYGRSVSVSLYLIGKYVVGTDDQVDNNIQILGGSYTTITGNEIYDGGQNIPLGTAPNTTICNNTMYRTSSVNIYVSAWAGDVTICNNRVWDTNYSLIRMNQASENYSSQGYPIARIWAYGNSAWNPVPYGQWVFITSGDGVNNHSPITLFFYHNTLAGSQNGLWLAYGSSTFGFNKFLFVNNVVQSGLNALSVGSVCNNASQMAGWDYNWSFGNPPSCPWMGTHNIKSDSKILNDTSLPNSTIAAVSSVQLNMGIDVSKSFTVLGKTYSPLPGFSSGPAVIGAGSGSTAVVSRPSAPINLNVSRSN